MESVPWGTSGSSPSTELRLLLHRSLSDLSDLTIAFPSSCTRCIALTRFQLTMAKPTVLHLGDAIKYNHDFYNTDFLARFNVVRNDALDRPSFIQALKEKRFVAPLAVYLPNAKCLGTAISSPSSAPSSRLGVRWASGTTSSSDCYQTLYAFSPQPGPGSTGQMLKRWDGAGSGTRTAPAHRTKQSQTQRCI